MKIIKALNEIVKDKGLEKETVMKALETSLISAYKRHYKIKDIKNIILKYDEITDEILMYKQCEVVEKVEDNNCQINLEDARKIKKDAEKGDIIDVLLDLSGFGRIAAQTAKNVILQKITEAEKDKTYKDFKEKVGDIVQGVVQRKIGDSVIFNLGTAEAILPYKEQVFKDNYITGTRMKLYLLNLRITSKGPQIIVSRSHPMLIKKLFEHEIPEITDKAIEIIGVARDAGKRSKIVVKTNDLRIDPIGSCVGARGTRIQSIVREINGEKIDIIPFSSEIKQFIKNVLLPAVVKEVIVINDKESRVIVPDAQLSLAIGKQGQNARLAAKLTGWKIDIYSESEIKQMNKLKEEQGDN